MVDLEINSYLSMNWSVVTYWTIAHTSSRHDKEKLHHCYNFIQQCSLSTAERLQTFSDIMDIDKSASAPPNNEDHIRDGLIVSWSIQISTSWAGYRPGIQRLGLRRLERPRQEHNGSLHIPTKATSEYRRQRQPRLYIGVAQTSLDVLPRNCNRGVVKGGTSPRWSKRGRLTQA